MQGGARRLALGTVQFGLAYGATHAGGRVQDDEARRILDRAAEAGIDTLDTAAGYGEAEAVLGRLGAASGFRIVTKTSAAGASDDGPDAESLIESGFQRSLARLDAAAIEGVLAHSVADLLAADGDAFWRRLALWKDKGQVRRIGVSVYDRADLEAVLTRFRPDLVQLPLNALDQRFMAEGALDRLMDDGIAVHVRSAFLQGLLLAGDSEASGRFAGLAPFLARWRDACREAGASQAVAALSFSAAHPAVERVVVGVQTAAQLEEIIAAADAPAPGLDWRSLACPDPALVDPRLWPKA